MTVALIAGASGLGGSEADVRSDIFSFGTVRSVWKRRVRVRLAQNLREMERTREEYWLRYPGTSPTKLRWRALAVRHCFHVLPGESILELGAGSGLWTEHLTSVLRGENPITAAVFNDDYAQAAAGRDLPNTDFVRVADLARDLPAESFDYVVGTGILCHDQYPQNLRAIYRLLKHGGQLFFFENNYWNPQVLLKNWIRPLGRWTGNAPCQVGLRKFKLMQIASQQGFTQVEVIPYDIVHPWTPRALVSAMQSLAFILEHTPVAREFCGTLYIWAKKPGPEEPCRPLAQLAPHTALFGSTSVVVPCHNEEMNIPRLVDSLVEAYGPYLHEILIVDDNSTDRTAEVTREVARRQPLVKLICRQPPNGVGRALREGYAAATGRYILTMDCDFVLILPELRDLFDAIAQGHEGAIGSRFSHQSVLINYPFFKILCNRSFHLLLNLLLPIRVRDVSNNLKLYRADILKNLVIEEPHFAANAETGLKPLLAGYDIQEVPISWINRAADMGASTFRIAKVGPNYFQALLRAVWRTWRGHRRTAKALREEAVRDTHAAGAPTGAAGPAPPMQACSSDPCRAEEKHT
jgi:dolichol-phosphate mannosyltransferase